MLLGIVSLVLGSLSNFAVPALIGFVIEYMQDGVKIMKSDMNSI
jgi:hypothetical protein